MYNNKNHFKIELYKNNYEYLGDIHNEWVVGDINYIYDDVDTFSICLPKMVGNTKNLLYDKIKSGMILVVTNRDGSKTRFIIKKLTNARSKRSGTKTFQCYEYQKKLESKRVSIAEDYYYLIDHEEKRGILNIITEQTGWSIGEVEDKALKNDDLVDEQKTINIGLREVDNITDGTLLYSTKLNLELVDNPYGNTPYTFSIKYNNVKVNDTEYGEVYNTFNSYFYSKIETMDCFYYNQTGDRFSVKYVFNLEDGTTKTFIENFVNCLDKTLEWSNMKFTYTTGNKVVDNTYKLISIKETSDNVFKLLTDLEELYDITFIYDTFARTINCYDRSSYESYKNMVLSLDKNCLEVSSTEDEDTIPTGVKVIGQEIDGEEINILSENIFGGDIIYNYDYYIENNILSDSCAEAWNKYLKILEDKKEDREYYKNNLNNIAKALLSTSNDINALQQRVDNLEDIKNVYISQNDTLNTSRIQQEINEYKNSITNSLALKNVLESQEEQYTALLNNYYESIKRENVVDANGDKIFSDTDLDMLTDIDEIIEVTDDKYTTPYTLYEHYKEYLKDKVTIEKTITISKDNMTPFMRLNNSLVKEGGIYLLNEELEEFLGCKTLRLKQIKYNPQKDSITQVVFSNKNRKKEEISVFVNLARNVYQLNSKLKNYETLGNKVNSNNEFIESLQTEGINLNKMKLVGENEISTINIDSKGISIVNNKDNNKELKLSSENIITTNNGWTTGYNNLNYNSNIINCSNSDYVDIDSPFVSNFIVEREYNSIISSSISVSKNTIKYIENGKLIEMDNTENAIIELYINDIMVSDNIVDDDFVDIKTYIKQGKNTVTIKSNKLIKVGYDISLVIKVGDEIE